LDWPSPIVLALTIAVHFIERAVSRDVFCRCGILADVVPSLPVGKAEEAARESERAKDTFGFPLCHRELKSLTPHFSLTK
jgi:hypothetical protein